MFSIALYRSGGNETEHHFHSRRRPRLRRLSCYGQEQFTTPNIDRLASEGMKFTQFYAGSTVCAPSRCSLMTGCHTGHAFIRGNLGQAAALSEFPIPSETVIVAKLLKKSGYATGCFGKWGLGGPLSEGGRVLKLLVRWAIVPKYRNFTPRLHKFGTTDTPAPLFYGATSSICAPPSKFASAAFIAARIS